MMWILETPLPQLLAMLDQWLLAHLPTIGWGTLTALVAFVIGAYVGMWIGEKRRIRFGLCFDHVIDQQCARSKAVYIQDNARRMFENYRSI